MQLCRKCNAEKNDSEFRFKRDGIGLTSICNSCRKQTYLPGFVMPTIVKASYLYFIKAENGKVKIGITDNLTSRFRNISSASPIPIQMIHTVWCESALIVEAEIHKMFMGFHSHGEWFDIDDHQILEAIEYANQKCKVVSHEPHDRKATR